MPLVDAVVALYPSNMVLPGDVEAPVVPITYGWDLEDYAVNMEFKKKVEEIHAKAQKPETTLPEMEYKIYRPGRHCFAVRGKPDDPLKKACLERSAMQILNWFRRWLQQRIKHGITPLRYLKESERLS